MKVVCHSIAKRYQYQWIIKNCDWVFKANGRYGIKGPNGSGKSTLLRILSGQLSQTSGKIDYYYRDELLNADEIFRHTSLVGPYTNLIEELTMREMYDFHFKFKPKNGSFDYQFFSAMVGLEKIQHKRTGEFSSGMNQRLQLALALLSKTSLLLLDEPTSFLDPNAKKWFYNLLEEYGNNRTVIIASNDRDDFLLCEEVKKVENLKTFS